MRKKMMWYLIALAVVPVLMLPRAVCAEAIITTVAGIPPVEGENIPAQSLSLRSPWAVARDSSGNLYIADNDNNRIRKVNTIGNISTVAGNGTSGYSGDGGAATSAQLNSPVGVSLDSSGNLYIADRNNNCIRKVDTTGKISTIVGNGTSGYSGDGGAATAAELYYPNGVALDSSNNLYIADRNNNCIRKVDTTGNINTVAGDGTGGYSGDGGAATAAQLAPMRVALDNNDNLYITSGNCIRKVDLSGVISTVAGNVTGGYSGDGGERPRQCCICLIVWHWTAAAVSILPILAIISFVKSAWNRPLPQLQHQLRLETLRRALVQQQPRRQRQPRPLFRPPLRLF